MHDGWSPYWRYQQATHALCAAHLLRELEGITDEPGQGWAAELAEWFTIACGQATLARDRGADRLEPAVLAGLTDRYDRILATGRAVNPLLPRPPGRRRRRSPAACLRTGRFCYQVARKAVSAGFIAFCQQLLAAWPTAPQVVVLCDNARYHRSKLVQGWLAGQPRLLVLRGARYSPHDNPTERIWGSLKAWPTTRP